MKNGTVKKYWAWDYEVHDLGCWPTRPPYAGHNEPREVYLATDIEPVLKAARHLAEEVIERPNVGRGYSDELGKLKDEARRLLAELGGPHD